MMRCGKCNRWGVWVFVSLLGLSSVTTASADELLRVNVEDDGTVVGTVVLDNTEDELRAFIGSPERLSELSDSVLAIHAKASGDCSDVKRKTRGLFEPLELNTRRCPTVQGWRETLAVTGDFTAWESEWAIRGRTNGTEVEYRLNFQPNMWVPQPLLELNVVGAVRDTLGALRKALKKKKKKR